MKKYLNIMAKSLTIMIASFMLLIATTTPASAYCKFTVTNAYDAPLYNMAVNFVKFDNKVIQKWDMDRDKGGNLILNTTNTAHRTADGLKEVDSKNPIMKAEVGKEYKIQVAAGNIGLAKDATNEYGEDVKGLNWYTQDFKIYVDFNQNDSYEDTEIVVNYDNTTSATGATHTIKIPDDAKGGKTTMRIICDYYAMDELNACETYYGEAREFTIELESGLDVGITEITSPVNPLKEGINAVKAILHNYGNIELKTCKINWSVDGTPQMPYAWKGSLALNEEVEITLGSYKFVAQKGLTMYKLDASSSEPNGGIDASPSNDAAPSYYLSMPIAPGTYAVGGSGGDFKSLKEVCDVLNLVGTYGTGELRFQFKEGTYLGQVLLDDVKRGDNSFIFEKAPNATGNVVIQYEANENNYLWKINNIDDVTISKMNFVVTNPNNWGGRVLWLTGSSNNFTFEKNEVTSVSPAPQGWHDFTLLQASDVSGGNHTIYKNKFMGGSIAIEEMDDQETGTRNNLVINKNIIENFTNRAIQVEDMSDALVTNNKIKTIYPSYFGIIVYDASEITNNEISGINGNAIGEAGIVCIHGNVDRDAIIDNNTIIGCNNINGITASDIYGGSINNNTIMITNNTANNITGIEMMCYKYETTPEINLKSNKVELEAGIGINVQSANANIAFNTVKVTNTGANVNVGLFVANVNGIVATNEIITDKYACMQVNSSNIFAVYNSLQSLGDVVALNALNDGAGMSYFYRNQIVNSNGVSAMNIVNSASSITDENNYWSSVTINGTDVNTLADIQLATNTDENSKMIEPGYLSTSSNQLTGFNPNFIFNSPLSQNVPEDFSRSEYEDITIDGKNRKGTFYIGAYNVVPTLKMIKQSKELIECEGTEDLRIFVAGKANMGVIPLYRWFKDGIELAGKTTTELVFDNFSFNATGSYQCEVYTPGIDKSLWSEIIPVYVLTKPTITDQPNSVINAVLANEYTFIVKSHYRGITPPLYDDKFQWFFYDADKAQDIPLESDANFAGTNTNLFTINALEDINICEKGDYYYVLIEGQCGIVKSEPFTISMQANAVIAEHPENIETCPAEAVEFSIKATVANNLVLEYQWKLDGLDLVDDAKINGANTATLQILDVAKTDVGSYYCSVNIAGQANTLISNPATLTLFEVPNAEAIGGTDIEITRRNDLTLIVNLLAGQEPVTVKWTYEDNTIQEGILTDLNGDELLTLLVEEIEKDQAGDYTCTLTNDCGEMSIVFNVTVKLWDGANTVKVTRENGFALYSPVPNPVKNTLNVKFEMPNAGNAVITITGMDGKVISEVYNAYAIAGENNIAINVSKFDLPAGVYVYTMTTNNFSASKPFVIVK